MEIIEEMLDAVFEYQNAKKAQKEAISSGNAYQAMFEEGFMDDAKSRFQKALDAYFAERPTEDSTISPPRVLDGSLPISAPTE